MKKIYLFFCVVFSLIFLANCAANSNRVLIDSGKNQIKINAEIADDNYEREKGLMFRKSLDENAGMLFVFDDEDYQTFWMKNTLIPLDMVFISKDMKIVDIKHATPCNKNLCMLYKSSKPVKYVLEVNYNFTAKNSIKIDDRMIINQ